MSDTKDDKNPCHDALVALEACVMDARYNRARAALPVGLLVQIHGALERGSSAISDLAARDGEE